MSVKQLKHVYRVGGESESKGFFVETDKIIYLQNPSNSRFQRELLPSFIHIMYKTGAYFIQVLNSYF